MAIVLFQKSKINETIGFVGDTLIHKRDSLLFYTKDGELVKTEYKDFVQDIKTSKDGKYILPFSSAFTDRIDLVSFPELKRVKEIDSIAVFSNCFVRAADFSLDEDLLYVLVEKKDGTGTVLYSINLLTFEKALLFEDKRHFSNIFYSQSHRALVIHDYAGNILFLRQHEIVSEIKILPFEKMTFIDNGQLILSSSRQGFVLSTMNGKTLRRVDFLLPKDVVDEEETILSILDSTEKLTFKGLEAADESTYAEAFVDLCYLKNGNLLFYLTEDRNEHENRLYVISLKHFRVKKVFSIKSKCLNLSCKGEYVFLKTTEGNLVYKNIVKTK